MKYHEKLERLRQTVADYEEDVYSVPELASAIKDLCRLGISRQQIADAFKMSVRWVSKNLGLLRNLAPEVLELMSRKVPKVNRLGLTHAELLGQVYRQPELQVKLAREVCQKRLNKAQTLALIQANSVSRSKQKQQGRAKASVEGALADLVSRYRSKTISDLELSRGLGGLVKGGFKYAEIARAFVCNLSMIWLRVSILALEPEVLEMMSAETPLGQRITFSNAKALTDIVGHPEFQIKLAKEIRGKGLSLQATARLIRARADEARILLASDKVLLEKEFTGLFNFVGAADREFDQMAVSEFRFSSMLDLYDVEQVRLLNETLEGCAEKCARMARMAKEHLSKTAG